MGRMRREVNVIELTPEQRQAVDQGEPVRVVDPATEEAYVVVRAEVYERLAGRLPPDETAAEIPPAILRAMRAFWRDLPELLRHRRDRGRWVAYHGDERIDLGKTRAEVYQRCLRRGLRLGEFYVTLIGEREAPPWVPTPLEESLFEVTDDEPPGAGSATP